jgi:hypothetical protein
MLDPKINELLIRIQIGDYQSNMDASIIHETEFLHQVFAYLKILSTDKHLLNIKHLFKLLILEIYSRQNQARERPQPIPIFSLTLSATVLPQLAYTGAGDIRHMKIIGDVRFSGGNEIVPHRRIESNATQLL